MIYGLYMDRSALPVKPPTCFHGPVRTAAHEIWCMYYCYYYYDIQPAHGAAHVFARAGPGRGP